MPEVIVPCMSYLKWLKGAWFRMNSPSIGIGIVVLALTQVPLAIKAVAELACIGEASNLMWKQTNSHKRVNIFAVNQCNGGLLYEIHTRNNTSDN